MAAAPRQKPRLLIVGAGFAGAKLATLTAADFDVTLVDRRDYFDVVFANHRALVDGDGPQSLLGQTLFPLTVRGCRRRRRRRRHAPRA